eukprot:CAMPEP_0183411566 /NCGR_PEP_ID=MMETSP0370-20130417/20408_1 /TAXON_ID=268820 /ORGANISM="Peridinium aciculiferum, Strain PAER-2" /LENGTH=43 /DNA_ID= /DNA_START= /DNA_END= /DNA_ORIENTATION=
MSTSFDFLASCDAGPPHKLKPVKLTTVSTMPSPESRAMYCVIG